MSKTSIKIDEQELRDKLSQALRDDVNLEQFHVVYAFKKQLLRTYRNYALAFSFDEGAVWVLDLDSAELERLNVCEIRKIKEKIACEYLVVCCGLHKFRRFCIPLLTGNPQVHQCTQIEGAQAFKAFCERINKKTFPATESVVEVGREESTYIESLKVWQGN